MRAMILPALCRLDENPNPLQLAELPDPEPGPGEILVRVSACGVCHTELDEIEGRTPPPRLPIVLGHQVVGRVAVLGSGAADFRQGDRVGVGWIHSACGACGFCRSGRENLCADFRATGRDANGGYAELMVVPDRFAYRIPDGFSDSQAAPLLCAGAIGYRSLRLSGLQDGQSLGLTGFGASAHLVLKMVRHRYPNSQVFVFSRTAAGGAGASSRRPGGGTGAGRGRLSLGRAPGGGVDLFVVRRV
jgi:propanol-preferring alcohol dehydrogenase